MDGLEDLLPSGWHGADLHTGGNLSGTFQVLGESVGNRHESGKGPLFRPGSTGMGLDRFDPVIAD